MAKLLISAVRCMEVHMNAQVIAGDLNARTSVFTDIFVPCPIVSGQSLPNRMAAKGGGNIIFTGATASVKALPPFIACAAANAAPRAIAAGLARAYGPKGLHVSHTIVDGGVEGAIRQKRLSKERDNAGDNELPNPTTIAEIY